MPRRRDFLRLPLALSTMAALGLVPEPGAAAAPDELRIGITQYPSTLNPLIDPMMAKSYVLAMTRRPLTTYDADWKLVCLLCVEVPSIENGLAEPVDLEGGKRGIKVTYTIRPDAVWGDGVPVTTEDVLFSWEVGRDPRSGVASLEPYRRIVKVDVKDGKTFTFTIDKLTFNYAASDIDVLPAHLEREAFAEPAQYRTRTRYDTDPANPGLCMGPYRIVETAPGSHIVLEPNPRWWGEKPAFRRITVRAIENTAALEANLLSGGIDMIAGELGLSLDQALAFEKRNGAQYRILYKPGLVYEHIDANLDSPVLQDRRVRQALLYGIDRAKISQQLFAGKQAVADSFVNPLDWVYTTEGVQHYGYDPQKAKTLLDEAGWKELRGGIRYNAKGEKLSLELMSTAGNRSRELVQQVVQSQWKQLGVEARIKNEPPRVMFGESLAKRSFQLAMYAWISAPEAVPRSTLRSDEIPSAANGYSGQNLPGFRNPEMDRLIDAIEVELDRDRRKALWREAQALYAAELPALPLYFRADSYILPKWLTGVTPTGHAAPSTLWVERWRAQP
jgi:peptide/nickel transport system substrate-binding protein